MPDLLVEYVDGLHIRCQGRQCLTLLLVHHAYQPGQMCRFVSVCVSVCARVFLLIAHYAYQPG